MEYAVEMLNITKDFPGIRANDDVTIRLKKGSIHALLGENGAGKSTLMSILFGLYQPTSGIIKINGKEVVISDPNVATDLGIGMVHQHFKLVECFTVTENIILGMEPTKYGMVDLKTARKQIIELSEQYGLQIDPDAKISEITVGMQQRVEILKMLYRNADILIFDEPTAVLTPQEIEDLIKIMHNLIKEGKSILLITHKLKEIKEVADECSVLRRGKYIGTVNVADTTEQEMADMMAKLRAEQPGEIGGLKVLAFSDYKASKGKNLCDGTEFAITLPSSDVVEFKLEDNAGVIVRPSGTEPKIKFYYTTKGRDTAHAQEIAERLSQSMKAELGLE